MIPIETDGMNFIDVSQCSIRMRQIQHRFQIADGPWRSIRACFASMTSINFTHHPSNELFQKRQFSVNVEEFSSAVLLDDSNRCVERCISSLDYFESLGSSMHDSHCRKESDSQVKLSPRYTTLCHWPRSRRWRGAPIPSDVTVLNVFLTVRAMDSFPKYCVFHRNLIHTCLQHH